MKPKVKFIIKARLMIILILVFTSSIFAYKNILTTATENRNNTINELNEEQFDAIWTMINILQSQSNSKISEVSKNIEKEILSLTEEERNQIQKDMSNNVHSETLHNILISNTEGRCLNNINNHRNGIVIMCNEGYMEDFNYRRAKEGVIDDSLFRTWQDTIDNSYNKELEEDAIDKLLNRTSGIIALESYDLTNNPDHIKIKELTYDSLLQVFLEEGITGLRNYQIFVPYYITDVGDIFGVGDIHQGIRVDNNKIIMVQEFNIYDQLTSGKIDLFNKDQVKNVMYRYDNLLRWLYLFGIVLIAAVCTLIFIFCSMYNTIVEQHDELNGKGEILHNKNKETRTDHNTQNTNES